MVPPGFLALEQIRHRAALVGCVVDSLAGTPLEGVEVTITSGPAAWTARLAALQTGQPRRRPERSVTDESGFFKYLDLPAGAYALRATPSSARYAQATGTATVTATGAAALTLSLAPTTLTGIINANNPAGPLAMARIRIVDSGEIAYTAANGSYTLSPLEPGTNRRIEISAPRYVTQTITVTLPAGQTTTRPPLTLIKSP